MHMFRSFLTVAAALTWATSARTIEVASVGKVEWHSNMCEASAAVPLSEAKHRMLVANDEDNVLRLYAPYASGSPLPLVGGDLNKALALDPLDENAKADFEGAAWLAGKLYIVASHSRSGKGKRRPSRLQLLQFSVAEQGGAVTLSTPKVLQGGLLQVLDQRDPRLHAAIEPGQAEVSVLAPEQDGLNIEALAATPKGGLMIGFRNPLAESGKALLVILENPKAVFEDHAEPKLGPLREVDLAGRGIRSLEYDEASKQYLIMAGAAKSGTNFELFAWSGNEKQDPVPVTGFSSALANIANFSPEAMYIGNDGRQLILVSDDGDIGSTACKNSKDEANKTFRSVKMTLKPAARLP